MASKTSSLRIRKNTLDSSFWVFTLPGFLIFSVVVLVPFVIGIGYSLTSWNGIAIQMPYVGLANYKKLITDDPRAMSSLWFTVRFTFTVVVLSNCIGFLLALGLTNATGGKGALRVIFFLPNVIGGLILGFIWRFILVHGVPSVGTATGIAWLSMPWLGDPATGFWGIVIVYVWKTAGYLMVIYIAALLSIDRSMLEAANIDGAPPLKILTSIKLPLVMPAITVCLFLMISWAFKLFDVIFSLTNGGPYGSTEAFALNIYNEAFLYNNYGYASAKAVLFFMFVALLTLVQVWLTKRKEVQL
jgi:raffinose/stachyose/melibiose transport system permease protein